MAVAKPAARPASQRRSDVRATSSSSALGAWIMKIVAYGKSCVARAVESATSALQPAPNPRFRASA